MQRCQAGDCKLHAAQGSWMLPDGQVIRLCGGHGQYWETEYQAKRVKWIKKLRTIQRS